MGVDGLFELRGERVQRTAERGDEDERADEDAGVEVQSEQEGAEPPATARRGGRGGGWGVWVSVRVTGVAFR